MPPAQAPITLDNLSQLNELGRWGKGEITKAVYSPNGQHLAVRTGLGIYIYLADTGEQFTFLPLIDPLAQIIYADNSQTMVISTLDGITFYETATYTSIRSLTVEGELHNIAFTSDLSTFALPIGDYNETITVYDTASLAIKDRFDVLGASHLEFSQDGLRLIIRAYSRVTVRDMASQQMLLAFTGGVWADYSAETGLLTFLQDDNRLGIWHIGADGITELGYIPNRYSETTSDIAFSPDGRLLAIGWWVTVEVWRVSDLTHLYTVEGSSTGQLDKKWPVLTAPPQTTGPGRAYVADLAFSPDGSQLTFTSGYRHLVVLDSASGVRLWDQLGASKNFVYSPNGDRLAAWTFTLSQWQADNGAFLNSLNQHIGAVHEIAFINNGQRLAIASADKRVYVRRVQDGALFTTLTGHTATVSSLAVSPNDQMLYSGSYDGQIIQWNLTDFTRQTTVSDEYSDYSVETIALVPNTGEVVWVGLSLWIEYLEGGILFSRSGEPNLLLEWQAASDGVSQWDGLSTAAVAVNPAGQYLAYHPFTYREYLHATLFDRTTYIRTALRALSPYPPEEDEDPLNLYMRHLTFSPDGRLLAGVAFEGALTLWPMPGAEIPANVGLIDALWVVPVENSATVTFSPDGQFLVTGSTGKIQFWRIDGTLLHTIELGGDWHVSDLTFSPDGKLLSVSTLEGVVHLWGLP